MRIKLNGGGRRRRKREEKKTEGEREERAVRIFVTKLSTFSKQSVSRERQAGIPKETLPSRVCGRARARSRPLKCNDFLGRSRADRRPRFLREAGADSICAQTRRHTTVTCRNRDEKTKRLSSLPSPPHPSRTKGDGEEGSVRLAAATAPIVYADRSDREYRLASFSRGSLLLWGEPIVWSLNSRISLSGGSFILFFSSFFFFSKLCWNAWEGDWRDRWSDWKESVISSVVKGILSEENFWSLFLIGNGIWNRKRFIFFFLFKLWSAWDWKGLEDNFKLLV